MKHILLTLIVLSALFVPLYAHADTLSYKEAWVFHYEFSLTFDGATVNAPYHIGAGDAVLPTPGTWKIEILAEGGDVLSTTQFQPGTKVVQVPYQDRGFNARVVGPNGTTQLLIGLAGSRTCDDNGVCNADQGENADNCPTDCGTTQVAQQAAIGNQTALPTGFLLVLADILVIGLVLVVDRRRRA